MKSKTEYEKPEDVLKLRNEIKEYKRFKMLMQQWLDLAIQKSKFEKSLE